MVRDRLRKAWGVKWGLRRRVRQLCFCRIASHNLNNRGSRVKRSRRQNMPATEAACVTAGRQALIIILERHSSQDRDGFYYLTLHYSAGFLRRTAFSPTATPHTGKAYGHKEQEEDRSCTIYMTVLNSTHTRKIKGFDYIAGRGCPQEIFASLATGMPDHGHCVLVRVTVISSPRQNGAEVSR